MKQKEEIEKYKDNLLELAEVSLRRVPLRLDKCNVDSYRCLIDHLWESFGALDWILNFNARFLGKEGIRTASEIKDEIANCKEILQELTEHFGANTSEGTRTRAINRIYYLTLGRMAMLEWSLK